MKNAEAGSALASFMVNTSWSIACATMILGATGNALASMICFMCLMCFGLVGIASAVNGPSTGEPYAVAFLFMLFFWPLGVCLLVCGLLLAMVRSVK